MVDTNNNDLAVLTAKLEVLHGDVGEIKTALSKLSDAITKLALVEERQSQTAQALERTFSAISKLEARISSLEQAAPDARRVAKWTDRAIWAGIAAVAVYAARKIGLI